MPAVHVKKKKGHKGTYVEKDNSLVYISGYNLLMPGTVSSMVVPSNHFMRFRHW